MPCLCTCVVAHDGAQGGAGAALEQLYANNCCCARQQGAGPAAALLHPCASFGQGVGVRARLDIRFILHSRQV